MSDQLGRAPEQLCSSVHAVVVSTAKTPKALEQRTIDSLVPQVGHITQVVHPTSIGASAMNQGGYTALGVMKASGLVDRRGKIIQSKTPSSDATHVLFVQAGVELGARAVSIMNRVMEADPQVGVVGPVTDGPAGVQQVAAVGQHYRTVNGFGLFSDYVAMLHRASHKPANRVDSFCMLTTVTAFLTLNGFDSRFDPAFYEDDDFCSRLAQELNLIPAIAYGAWVGWPEQQPWPEGVDPGVTLEANQARYSKKWEAYSRLTLAGSLPPEKGKGLLRY